MEIIWLLRLCSCCSGLVGSTLATAHSSETKRKRGSWHNFLNFLETIKQEDEKYADYFALIVAGLI